MKNLFNFVQVFKKLAKQTFNSCLELAYYHYKLKFWHALCSIMPQRDHFYGTFEIMYTLLLLCNTVEHYKNSKLNQVKPSTIYPCKQTCL